ncbi:unnamed protein product [Cuscuta campestris]|uniref:Trafficking protein particle complex subunit 11 domain-containing protein n=1 Tax=Cuscuta campestris TaxID=132261 RepID=A0A484LGR5_9ASTE|nr:unnamed protein product [Cuscuta campestris]
MEEFPDELRTPPIALVTLVGCPDLHAPITAHLHAEQPPINSLALPEISKISILSKRAKENSAPAQPVGGILNRDWLSKHRTRVPAVVAAIFDSVHVSGDPAQWLQVCTDLENLKAAIRGRNSKLVVVVVSHSKSKDELSEDRMVALRKRAELDPKHLIVFVPDEPSRLQHSLKRLGSTFAELANGYYKDEGRRIKTRLERRNYPSVELNIRYCFKVAVYAEFRRDWGEALRMYEDAYHVLREMVATSTRLPPIQRLVEIKTVAEQLNFKISTLLLHGGKLLEAISWFRQHNASYRQLAGAPEVTFLHWEWLSRQFLVFAELLETSSATDLNTSTVVSGTADTPTEWEFHSAYYFQVLELFFLNSLEILDSVTNLYRQEGWVTLLWDALCNLRECSRKCGIVKDFVEYSLEMAALPNSSLSQRETIHKEVFAVVRGDESGSGENDSLRVHADKPLYIEIDLISPLRAVLLASVAFHEQMIKPGAPTMITLSLLSQLPLNVEIDQLEIQFNQSECNFIIVNGQRSHLAAISCVQPGRRVETAPTLELITNKWIRLTYEIKSELSGKLECIYVIARMGLSFSISCRAESPASMNDLPLWKYENRVESIPTKDPSLAFSGQKAVQVEEPDPRVDLSLASSCLALVGEIFTVPVIITSKGHAVHSGELKINLVDTRGGGLLSPREAESFSIDNLHVELVSISRQYHEDKSIASSENIQKIQPSFGLIPVPFLNEGDSWSCELEIRWNRPKPIMLYVSLGYYPLGTEKSPQKVNVHKSLQIEGKTGIVMSHQFMLPFLRDPLLLSKIKPPSASDPEDQTSPSLPSNETSFLIVTAKNTTEVPLLLESMSIDASNDDATMGPTRLVAGEEFKKVFPVTPKGTLSVLKMGAVELRWRRDSAESSNSSSDQVLTKHSLPDVKIESPPLVLSLNTPPHAVLGDAFTYAIKISNRTPLLQEIRYSLADSQSFVLSGSHNDTIFVLPKSDHILIYKVVPLASGFQQLPRVTVTAARYTAGFQPSATAATVFVFPTKPQFKHAAETGNGSSSVPAEQK